MTTITSYKNSKQYIIQVTIDRDEASTKTIKEYKHHIADLLADSASNDEHSSHNGPFSFAGDYTYSSIS